MNTRFILPIYFICLIYLLTNLHAIKEDRKYGSQQQVGNVASRFRALVKRLQHAKGIDVDSLQGDDSYEQSCKTFNITRNSVIQPNRSIKAGAKYVDSQKAVSDVNKCSKLCCEQPSCDTSIYQEDVSIFYAFYFII